MTSVNILAISASPSPQSKTALLVDAMLGSGACSGSAHSHIRLCRLNPVGLVSGDPREPSLADFAAAVQVAHGLIIATPIFKASFSGLLKLALDLLPQYGLAGKVVLPIATGGSVAHLLALDYGLRPVLQSMGARHVVQSHFVAESDLPRPGAEVDLSQPCFEGLFAALANFRHSLTGETQALRLGHPRPSLLAAS